MVMMYTLKVLPSAGSTRAQIAPTRMSLK